MEWEDVVLKYDYEYYDTLDEIRRSGVTNMWGAPAVLMDYYPDIDKQMAKDIVHDWMDSYAARREQGVTGD